MRRATTRPPSAWPTHKIPTGPRPTRSPWPMTHHLPLPRRRIRGHRRHRFGLRRRAGTQQGLPVNGPLADHHLRSGNDGTGHRNGDQYPADRGSRLGEMTVHPGAAAPPTALQSAPPAAPQQVPNTVHARAGRSAARCGSAGDAAAADHPVAGTVGPTDSSATPVLRPAAAKPAVVPGRTGPPWGHGGSRHGHDGGD